MFTLRILTNESTLSLQLVILSSNSMTLSSLSRQPRCCSTRQVFQYAITSQRQVSTLNSLNLRSRSPLVHIKVKRIIIALYLMESNTRITSGGINTLLLRVLPLLEECASIMKRWIYTLMALKKNGRKNNSLSRTLSIFHRI